MKRTQGFTLIELLVVMGIISLLAVAVIPMIIEGKEAGNQAADEANLRWHYQAITLYTNKRNGLFPRGGGHRFVLDPWVRGTVQRTKENRDRYFSPTQLNDERVSQIRSEVSVDELWRNLEELTSEDTSYAGRGRAFKRKMESGREAWMATDNEYGNFYNDGMILVLMGSGVVRKLLRDPDLINNGWPEELGPEEFDFPVGPESPHPLLQKLEH